MKISIKQVALYLVKYLGGFALARHLTRSGLRVLCYHGLAYEDEHEFRPRLFMSQATFARRMALLRKGGYPVLPLADALESLRSNALPSGATVITFDDGWRSFYELAAPQLSANCTPATVYVTTYYVEKQCMVFNLAVQYLIWRSGRRHINVAPLLAEPSEQTLEPEILPAEAACRRLMAYGESLHSSERRQALLTRLGEALGINPARLAKAGIMTLMDSDQLHRVASTSLFDVQLHTHRHSMGDLGAETLTRELADNRRALRQITGRPLVHFCYPSGRYDPSLASVLRQQGISSATTCVPGFTYTNTPELEIPRILDEEELSEIEFEAELSGFLELCRWFKQRRAKRDKGKASRHIDTAHS